jgi:hypothetical protein
MNSSSSQWSAHHALSWDQREYADPHADDHDSNCDIDPDDMNLEECSIEFLNLLTSLKLAGTLSAKQVCLLSFWARGGGLCNPGASLAVHPAKEGGAFSKHFDKVIGLDRELKGEFYEFPMPMLERWSLGRTVGPNFANFAYKQIKSEVENVPGFWDSLRADIDKGDFGLAYSEHPLVVCNPAETIVPLGIYLDGVAYQNRDKALGLWIINLSTNKRHLAMVFKNKAFCRCGCHYWCSLYSAFEVLGWLVRTMASGKYPSTRHDDSQWALGDSNHDLADTSLGYKAAVIMVKGDWAEFALTMGMPTWAHHTHPCFACKCTGGGDGTMKQTQGVSVLGLPWAPKTDADYKASVATSMQTVTVASQAEHSRLLGSLKYDKSKQGSRGRTVMCDIAALNLQKGDRVEPSALCREVGSLDARAVFPHTVNFWRPSRSELTRHDNPLFREGTHVTIQTLCADEMHTMHLGVFASFCVTVLWAVILQNVWGLSTDEADETRHRRLALRLRHELVSWYAARKKSHPDEPVYEIPDFDLSTLGSQESPVLKAKAAETGTLVKFCADLCRTFEHKLQGGRALVGCASALETYMRITRNSGVRLSVRDRQGLMDAALSF